MSKGWGYGKNSMSLSDRIRTGKRLKFESEKMKVYEYIYNKNVYTYFKDITIRYINNLQNKSKTIIISGLYKTLNYNCSQFKNQFELFEYVANTLINEYLKYNIDLEEKALSNI